MLEQSIRDVRDLNLTDKEDTPEVCKAEAYLAMHRLGCSFGSKKEEADPNEQDRVLNKVTYEEITSAINIAQKAFTEDNVGMENDQKNFIKPALQYALATRELQPGRCDAKHKV